MIVKPKSGRVPDPDNGGFLPESGRRVPKNSYWLRQLEAGSVVEVKPKKKESRK